MPLDKVYPSALRCNPTKTREDVNKMDSLNVFLINITIYRMYIVTNSRKETIPVLDKINNQPLPGSTMPSLPLSLNVPKTVAKPHPMNGFCKNSSILAFQEKERPVIIPPRLSEIAILACTASV